MANGHPSAKFAPLAQTSSYATVADVYQHTFNWSEVATCFMTTTPEAGLQNLRAYKTWILFNSWATGWRITLLNWEFLLKWYNFFWNLLNQISCCAPRFPLILTAKLHSLYAKKSESDILSPTLQSWLHIPPKQTCICLTFDPLSLHKVWKWLWFCENEATIDYHDGSAVKFRNTVLIVAA